MVPSLGYRKTLPTFCFLSFFVRRAVNVSEYLPTGERNLAGLHSCPKTCWHTGAGDPDRTAFPEGVDNQIPHMGRELHLLTGFKDQAVHVTSGVDKETPHFPSYA